VRLKQGTKGPRLAFPEPFAMVFQWFGRAKAEKGGLRVGLKLFRGHA